MSARVLVCNGRVICPVSGRDAVATVEIVDGHIAGIHPGSASPGPGGRVFDAGGCVVAPGFVDLHAHTGEPGFEHRETLATAGAAAARGGFTAICARPDTRPVNDTRAVTEYLVRRGAEVSPVRIWPVAALTVGRKGERLTEMVDLRAAGAVAFGDGDRSVADAGLLRRGMEYARAVGAPVFEYCEDARLARGGVMHEGPEATRLGLRGSPAAAEDVVALRAWALARQTGAPIHLGPISTRGAVEAVRLAKAEGLSVTCAVSAAHLHLTDAAIAAEWSPSLNVRPPLRPRADVDALRAALADGTIDAITSGHMPQSPVEKDEPFGRAAPGMIGLETTLGLALRLVDEGVITLVRAIELLSAGPMRALRRVGGQLVEGAPADVVVFDPLAKVRVDGDTLHSRSRNTPFLGQALPGRVVATLVGGRPALPAAHHPSPESAEP